MVKNINMPRLVNVTEEIVLGLVKFLLHGTEYQTFCHCKSCELEIAAYALNNLPPYYVTTSANREEAFDQLKTSKNIQQINKQIIIAIHEIGKPPNHTD